ncbi:MAG: UbiA family prenyltransferase [Gammaproteobacteria bacterium]|nr:MAG: UbiA family prenyltransferase [Gammaproteobacteria bacterium]
MLKEKINAVVDSTSRMVLATSVDGLSSSASVFFARDGDDFLFFTFNPTRKARQIAFNPVVQMSIWPGNEDGIRGIRVEGVCRRIRQADAIRAAREKILAVTDAFQQYMDDEFLDANGVTGYYRIKPTRITLIDFYAESRFQSLEFPQNRVGVLAAALSAAKSRLLLWIQAVRAPFFTATLIPVLLGATIARGDLTDAGRIEAWSWSHFWLVIVGALAAHAGTNLANDYGDHVSGNDELNHVPSPFNGGSRMIQAGLLAPWKVLLASIICFIVTIAIGLRLNQIVAGAAFATTPLLYIGIAGCFLGASYTLGPYRLGYRGMGEIAIAAGFGPVIALGTHYVLSAHIPGSWDWLPPLLASLPVAIFVVLIIWINQFQDVPADRLVNKRNWVVRCAEVQHGRVRYERPLELYRLLGYLGFSFVLLLSIVGSLDDRFGTFYALLALIPLPLLLYANRLGKSWLEDWNEIEADRQRLPYSLLKVNAITVGIHLSTGILLVLAYTLQTPY